MVIKSFSNNKIMLLKKLQLKKHRDLEKLFIVEGEHLVNEAIKNKVVKELYILEDNDYEFEGPKNYVSKEIMKKITALETISKVIGVCYIKENVIEGNKLLLLDNIQDPGNLGTIIRNAVAFNIETIIMSNDSVDLYNEKVLRSAQGMNFNINIVVSDLINEIKNLKNNGFYIYGTDLNSKKLSDINKKNKFCLVVGNEGSGIKKEILELCDENIKIKMNSKCESLNVGVATGIILYELSR